MVVALVLLGVAALLIAGAGLVLVRRARGDAQRAREDAARLDAELAVAERRGRQVLRDLPFVALRVDRDGRLVEANPVALERFPFLVAGHDGAGGLQRAPPRAATSTPPSSGLSRQSFEVRLFAGGRRTYRAAVEPYEVGEVGEAREALVFLTDQSEAVAYQELRSQFVANVSHELRTPLTGLRGLLEALDDPADGPRDAPRLRRARGERDPAPGGADHGHPLPVRARDDAGPALVVAQRPGPGGRAPRSPTCRTSAEEHGVRLELDADGPAWTPLTDRMAATVVRNLVENAVKYAGPGATAATTVRREGDAGRR